MYVEYSKKTYQLRTEAPTGRAYGDSVRSGYRLGFIEKSMSLPLRKGVFGF